LARLPLFNLLGVSKGWPLPLSLTYLVGRKRRSPSWMQKLNKIVREKTSTVCMKCKLSYSETFPGGVFVDN
jgi:hypothetical protein